MRSILLAAAAVFALSACNQRKDAPTAEATPAAPAPRASASAGGDAGGPASAQGALHLGAPIEASVPSVALADVARAPKDFVGKKFVTRGTVTAVCQHKGCWMEIEDEGGKAHVKMAGHKFFVPRTASGHEARVLSTLVVDEDASCGDEEPGMAAESAGDHAGSHPRGASCRDEAEAQLGRPLAKLSLVAEGVELL